MLQWKETQDVASLHLDDDRCFIKIINICVMGETHYKDKYLIASTRRVGYDYSQDGYYFVTICVQDRDFCFGEILNEKMQLSELGVSAHECWLEIPQHFPFVILNEFVVMPNHVHGILQISQNQSLNVDDVPMYIGTSQSAHQNNNLINTSINKVNVVNSLGIKDNENFKIIEPSIPLLCNVDIMQKVLPIDETQDVASLQPNNNYKNKFGSQSNNLSSIIRGYKIGVTKFARNNDIEFYWQERFYDRIIWNDDVLDKATQYIINNPAKWELEKNGVEGLYM